MQKPRNNQKIVNSDRHEIKRKESKRKSLPLTGCYLLLWQNMQEKTSILRKKREYKINHNNTML